MTSNMAQALDSTQELEITVTGRKSGKNISFPVWFVRQQDRLYLLPVRGSDTQWYRNVLQTPVITIAAGGTTAGVKAQPITDPRRIGDIANQFRKKYGAGDVKKYYSKFDVALELDLPRQAAA
ncbi:MAG TPA: nitroreductase/quinone reductase family protein [Terriglobales bacterium]|jgi:deazaflavin-dependent oxidoreductase (nitroreductase family)|nr:nitroreductase/quinone reductase family protein [Terriglobales bacterium]